MMALEKRKPAIASRGLRRKIEQPGRKLKNNTSPKPAARQAHRVLANDTRRDRAPRINFTSGESAPAQTAKASIEIKLAHCYPSPHAREIDDAAVNVLAASVAEIGLLEPITVRRIKKPHAEKIANDFEVLCGLHRVKAFQQLGRTQIPAFVRDVDDLVAELIQIDENLQRKEFSPAQRAAAVARRAAIERIRHGSSKAKGAHAANAKLGRNHDANAKLADAFSNTTAKATGLSTRTVQREIQRGAALGADMLKRVVGTSLDRGDEIDALASLSSGRRAGIVERAAKGDKVSAKAEVKKEKREAREQELGAFQGALPQKKFGIIVADVPRRFNVRSRKTGLDRAPENHYPTMTFEELVAMPIGDLAADECILFMWTTAASLIDDVEIMAEWGFLSLRPRDGLGKLTRPNDLTLPPRKGCGEYKSHQVWLKDSIGLGYWFRDKHELVLVGVRGKPVPPAQGTQDDSTFAAPKGEHSEKPDHLLEMIERLWPTTPKLELFRRGPVRTGWSAFGNEARP